MEQEEEENMCDSVLYADPGRRSQFSTRIGRSAVDVMISTFEYVAHAVLFRNHGRHYAVVS